MRSFSESQLDTCPIQNFAAHMAAGGNEQNTGQFAVGNRIGCQVLGKRAGALIVRPCGRTGTVSMDESGRKYVEYETGQGCLFGDTDDKPIIPVQLSGEYL